MNSTINKKKSNNKKTADKVNKSSRRITVKWQDLSVAEQRSVVCRLFCNGKTLTEIAETVSENYKTDFKRQSPYKILSEAATEKWLTYVPPTTYLLESRLKKKYKWLKSHVVQTSQFEDVAHHGAEQLLELLRDLKTSNGDEVHLGFAGGHAMKKLANTFSKMVTQPDPTIPKKIVLHAIVAGFDVYEPTTDPNPFFTLFQTPNPAGVEFSFVGLHAPAVVLSERYKEIQKLEGIEESYKEKQKIDIIVTSATNWSDEDSTFRKYMEKSTGCFDMLSSANCIGDMLWQPISPQQIINIKTKIRAMTLLELSELPGLINKGKKVLLVVGACSRCNQPKSDILRAILDQKDKILTHLVADSLSVRGMLDTG
jgi:DNA-binding transcriptional regulator LsrR (DeoR family)